MQGFNKIHRSHLRKARIKATHIDIINFHLRKKLQLFAQAGEPRGRSLRAKKFTRMRLKNHHGGLQTAPLCRLAQLLQQGLMTQMHTVEVADRKRDRLRI